ncbi:MAG: YkvA family protein [Lachnospiraceae bacterium]
MDLKKRASQLKTDIPAVFLALSCKETPLLAKIMAGMIVGYALSPIDFIPDFIPVIGYLDDVILLPLLIAWTIKMIPPTVFAQCRKRSEHLWENGKPQKWYYAIPVVLLWLLILWLIFKQFIR